MDQRPPRKATFPISDPPRHSVILLKASNPRRAEQDRGGRGSIYPENGVNSGRVSRGDNLASLRASLQLPPVAPDEAAAAAPDAAPADPPAAPPLPPPPGDPWFIDSSFDGEAADAPATERLEP